jgi:hypothetical protein
LSALQVATSLKMVPISSLLTMPWTFIILCWPELSTRRSRRGISSEQSHDQEWWCSLLGGRADSCSAGCWEAM